LWLCLQTYELQTLDIALTVINNHRLLRIGDHKVLIESFRLTHVIENTLLAKSASVELNKIVLLYLLYWLTLVR
jgi:hypothetical protein